MPVFFKFDLEEVLEKCSSLCYYSTGNMQSTRSKIFRVTDDPYKIDANNLYSTGFSPQEQEKKQQEFLIKNEFDFSNINNFQIICYDSEEEDVLKSIFKDDPICKHIYSIYEAEDVFEHENPQLLFKNDGDIITVTTLYKDKKYPVPARYNGDYIFQIESNNISKIHVLNPNDVKVEKKNIIQLNNTVEVEMGDTPFDLYYVNLNPEARSPRWLIYQYAPVIVDDLITKTDDIADYLGVSFEDNEFKPEELITAIEVAMPKLEDLYNTRVRHYIVKNHTLLVCKQFENYAFDYNKKIVNIDILRVILALHDIGKAIDRKTQHEHTLSLINEFWNASPFKDYELKIAEALLKDDHMGKYFQNKYDLTALKEEIVSDADNLNVEAKDLLQLKMILYQCDIASYTKDAGGLEYLEHMFVYDDAGEKTFNENENLLNMAPEYWGRYLQLKSSL